MKRPFAAVGFTAFAVSLVLSYAMSSGLALYACLCFAAAGIFSIIVRSLRQTVTVPVCLLTAAAVCLLFFCYNGERAHTQSLVGESSEVRAAVAEAPYIKADTGRHYCVLELESVGGEKASGRLRLSFSPTKDGIDDSQLEIGNSVSFTARVYVPGESDAGISRYFTGEDILLGAYGASDFTFSEPATRGINYYFHLIRSFVSERLRHGFGDRIAGLLIGMLTGDKSVLDEELYKSFRVTGVAHLLAVSGLHLSVWVYSLGALIPEKGKGAKIKYAFMLFAVLFIMLLAGMSESVKRAGFMSIVFLLGRLSGKRSDSLNSLGLAVFVMILFNPACVLSLSLQLSFLSTLGIITLGQLYIRRSADYLGGKNINSPSKKLARYFTDVFFISISVLVFTFPVLIFNFGGISTVSAWVNILIAPVVTPMLLMSGAYVLLSGVDFVACPVSVAVKYISEYVISVTDIFSRAENAFLVFEIESLPLYLAAAVTVAGLSVAFLLKSNARLRYGLVLSAAVICAGLVGLYEYSNTESVRLHLADYDGEVLVAVENDGRAILTENTDSYERGLFISALEEKGVEAVAFIKNNALYSLADGKRAEEDLIRGFDGDIGFGDGGKIIKAADKYICIFSAEALQKAGEYDIIIAECEGGADISIGGMTFTLERNGGLTLILKDKLILRGEGSWQNLMKSN